MISLSRIYKSAQLKPAEKKIISNNHKIPSVEKIHEDNQQEKNEELNEKVEQIILEAEEKAKEIINKSKEEANQLLEEEKEKIEKWWAEKREEDKSIIQEIKENGFQEGFDTGFNQGKEQAEKEYEALIHQAKSILEEAYQTKENIIQEAEPNIIELASLVAEKIINKELELDKEIIVHITKEALRKTKEVDKISIYVSPSEISYIQNAREELLMEQNGQVELMIFPDSSIEAGGCIVKTSYGTLDAKIDTQLEEVRNILYDISGRRNQ